MTQRIRRFRPMSRFDGLSRQTYGCVMRAACVKKGMAVSDNGPKPLLGANQNIVSYRDTRLA